MVPCLLFFKENLQRFIILFIHFYFVPCLTLKAFVFKDCKIICRGIWAMFSLLSSFLMIVF